MACKKQTCIVARQAICSMVSLINSSPIVARATLNWRSGRKNPVPGRTLLYSATFECGHTCSVYNISKACFQLKSLRKLHNKTEDSKLSLRGKEGRPSITHTGGGMDGYLCKSSNLRNKRTSWCLTAAAFKCADETYKWFAAASRQTNIESVGAGPLIGRGCPPRDSEKG
ncbi:hypothetical protein CEXT_594111 [Caerostris extrusa]|uniref:Uncharacterized protein n=1 Tax=Caerostris extrusa TaxID=172846 RepID=A0AAV4T646_CAEEX|nr:hypothetical protein CEXT_594111 [Caerostris extrusa]